MSPRNDHQVPTEPVPDNDPLPDGDPTPEESPVPDHNPVTAAATETGEAQGTLRACVGTSAGSASLFPSRF
jgi:hypothetical protein